MCAYTSEAWRRHRSYVVNILHARTSHDTNTLHNCHLLFHITQNKYAVNVITKHYTLVTVSWQRTLHNIYHEFSQNQSKNTQKFLYQNIGRKIWLVEAQPKNQSAVVLWQHIYNILSQSTELFFCFFFVKNIYKYHDNRENVSLSNYNLRITKISRKAAKNFSTRI